MFYWAVVSWVVVFLVVAPIAAVLGFTAIAGTAANIAWILFVVGVILFVVITGIGPSKEGLRPRPGLCFWHGGSA